MPRRALEFVLLSALLLAACGPTAPLKPDRPAAVEELALRRPAIVPERVAEELLAAIALLKADNFRQAEALLEEIVKLRPDIAEAQFNLGWARQQLNKCPEAIPALQAGLQNKPGETRAIHLLAICERTLGRFSAAEKTYLQALALAPDDARLHLDIGILYELYLFKPPQALEHYRRYQSRQNPPDSKVGGWIALLERKNDQ